MGLPKSLIKKYGISKRAWAVYRSGSTKVNTKVNRTMAKRRHKKSRGRFSFLKKGMGNTGSLLQVDSMIYGALREKASTMLSPVTSKLPLGDLSDELAMGLLTYFVAKKTSGLISDVAKKGLVIENARVGEYIAKTGLSGLTGSSGSSSTSVNMYG